MFFYRKLLRVDVEDVYKYFAMFLYTTVVHATDWQTTFVAHCLHLCGTPEDSVLLSIENMNLHVPGLQVGGNF